VLGICVVTYPRGNPQTNPAAVTHELYPINGGKLTTKVAIHRMIQPPGKSLHFSAMGSSMPKIFSLKMRNRTPSTRVTTPAAMSSERWIRESWR